MVKPTKPVYRKPDNFKPFENVNYRETEKDGGDEDDIVDDNERSPVIPPSGDIV